MRKYLLDTNVVSEIRKRKPHGGVLSWLGGMRYEQVFISAVTLGELQSGVELTRQQDPHKAQEIELWIDRLDGHFRVLPMDGGCFREWARLMLRQSGHLTEDAMIAATAKVNGLVVATRNEADFAHFHVPIFNPFRTNP